MLADAGTSSVMASDMERSLHDAEKGILTINLALHEFAKYSPLSGKGLLWTVGSKLISINRMPRRKMRFDREYGGNMRTDVHVVFTCTAVSDKIHVIASWCLLAVESINRFRHQLRPDRIPVSVDVW